MKKKTISIVLLFILNIALGQNKEVIAVINGNIAKIDILKIIDPKKIESVKALKRDIGVALYGSIAVLGVIEVKTTISEKTLKLLLNQYGLEFKTNFKKKKLKLTGIISDCENIPLSNVTITNLNSKEIYKSDENGKYNIIVNKKDILEFSALGFISQRVFIDKQKVINILLKLNPVNPKNNGIILKKPIIYLYPKTETNITINLDFKGELLTTFPKYDQKWEITAYPDGKIFEHKTNRFYTSLFWDGTFNFPKEHYNYKEGFVVSRNDLNTFIIEKLEHIGLNTFETNDFVQYWLPILEKNEFTFIHFRLNSDYDVISKNIITPKPDTSIRVFMDFYPLDKMVNFPEQILPKTQRKGFTLVEWGGSDVSMPIKEMNNL